jgi:hypothetical protein
MKDKTKATWRWRILRWGLIGVAVLLTLLAVAITEENWRGKRNWENYKRQSAAQGDPIDGIAYSTNQIPDDKNFAKAPIFAGLSTMKWNEQNLDWERANPNEIDPLNISAERSDNTWVKNEHNGDWRLGKFRDLKAWQEYYRNTPRPLAEEFPIAPHAQTPAADVLLALSRYNPAIEQMRLAANRPYSRFASDDYTDVKTMSLLLIYLREIKSFSSVVQLRVLAELANGQTTQAVEDIQLLLRLTRALRQEPFLISHLVSLANLSLVLQPIYEGLARGQWSDAQLAELEKGLAAQDCLADFQKAMRDERAYAIETTENERRTGEYRSLEYVSGTNVMHVASLRLMPSAFFYQSELAYARVCQDFCLPLVDLKTRMASPGNARRIETEADEQKKHFNPYKVLALMNYPSISHSVENFARNQSYDDLAEVACALERYHLAHGVYPETLDLLVPQFIDPLPHDVIDGQPLRYHRTDDGKFMLYSIGWNEKDDGGKVVSTKSGAVEPKKGDWVWCYP